MQIYPLRCTNRHTPLYSQAKSHIKSAGTCMLKVILYTKFLYVGCITEAHDGIAMSFVTSNYNTLGKSNTKPTYTPKYFHFNMFCLFVCFFQNRPRISSISSFILLLCYNSACPLPVVDFVIYKQMHCNEAVRSLFYA